MYKKMGDRNMSEKNENSVELPTMTEEELANNELVAGIRKPYDFSKKEDKARVEYIIREKLRKLPDLKDMISKVEINKNGIYLNRLNEDKKGVKWIRIIAYDKDCTDCDSNLCTAKRHTIRKGYPLVDTLEHINKTKEFLIY
jgi:hypothetical protein